MDRNLPQWTRRRSRLLTLSTLCLFLLTACGGGSPSTVGSDSDVNPGPGDPEVESSTLLIGSFILDEYIDFLEPEWLGVIQVNPSPVAKLRIIDGSRPRRLSDGRILYRRSCGQFGWQFMLADTALRATPVTPCSSDLAAIGNGRARFDFAQLSGDGATIAVEAAVYNTVSRRYEFRVLVFRMGNQTLIADWQNAWSPLFLPSGALALSSSGGLLVLDAQFDNPQRYGDFQGGIANPTISPDQQMIAFEHNQQIWGMKTDGTDARALIVGGSRLKYPAWSPDGKPAIAYLQNPDTDKYEEGIFVTNFETGENAAVDLRSHLSGINTVNGPISWYQ